MPTQYDRIAQQYDRIIGNLPVRQLVEYTYRARIGDVTGKTVLDLACGNGLYTRKFKEQGAARVVGVDISQELIDIARQHEARDPIGVEYLVGDGQTLGKIGDFDLVTTAFLLNYAPTEAALQAMCAHVAANLRGDRFVAINLNVGAAAQFYNDESYFAKYGVMYRLVSGSLDTSALVRMTVAWGGDQVQFDVCHLPPAAYERALRAAGFQTITWHPPELPPAFEANDGRAHWQQFLETPTIIILEAAR